MPKLSVQGVVKATRVVAAANAAGYCWYREFPQPRDGLRLALVAPSHATIVAAKPFAKHAFESSAALDEYVREVGAARVEEAT